MFCLMSKLKRLKTVLQEIIKNSFSDIEVKYEEVRRKLVAVQISIQSNPQNALLLNDEWTISQELKLAQKAKEGFLLRKSKLHWLKDEDKTLNSFIRVSKCEDITIAFTIL